MERNEIEELIAKKVTEAKLDVAEKRLGYLLVLGTILLAVVGIGIPLYQSSQQTEKVEKAIIELKQTSKETKGDLQKSLTDAGENFISFKTDQKARVDEALQKIDNAIVQMNNNFDELSGHQLRKPNVECTYNAKPLEGSTIVMKASELYPRIVFKNYGDAPAENIHLKIYFNPALQEYYNLDFGGIQAERTETSDEPGYDCCFETGRLWLLDPDEHNSITLSYYNFMGLRSNVLMKVFYEQPKPKRFAFIIDATRNE